jgi:hypothetical protein
MQRIVLSETEINVIVLLVLQPGYNGDFHNHPGVDCSFEVVYGELEEVIHKNGKYIFNTYYKYDKGFINDSIGVHKISSSKGSVSLHTYEKHLGNYFTPDIHPSDKINTNSKL